MNANNTEYLLNFVLPQGPTGPSGPEGPAGTNIARSAYLATFNNGTVATGIAVDSGERLPIDREELDISDLITLDSNNETIQFNIPGYYKVSFTVSAYALHSTNSTFDPSTDFVSIGFVREGTDNVYIGTSQWITDEVAVQLFAQGIISVVDISETYVLQNLGKRQLYLQSPDLKDTASTSYFASPLITVVIEYLGRQGA